MTLPSCKIVKLLQEVKHYVQNMTSKHGCDAFEKIATRAVELERKIMCSVCLDKDCQIVFSCGHMICERCDQSLRKCHICRMKILRRVKIFIWSGSMTVTQIKWGLNLVNKTDSVGSAWLLTIQPYWFPLLFT